jgi:hypothetical protein
MIASSGIDGFIKAKTVRLSPKRARGVHQTYREFLGPAYMYTLESLKVWARPNKFGSSFASETDKPAQSGGVAVSVNAVS